MDSLKEFLHSLGYNKLLDVGEYWRAKALYRGGNNDTALQISKKYGYFYDFVDGTGGSLDDLVALTLNINKEKVQEFYKNKSLDITSLVDPMPDKEGLSSEKKWSPDILETFLPHYKFYLNKGISEKTLRFFKSGFCHAGDLNMRYVFPIFNAEGFIHGFSGRDVTNKSKTKWKHLGAKTSWIYPAFMYYKDRDTVVYPFFEDIKQKKSIVLVESIGDMLRLWEYGYKNVLVTFGLKISSKLASFIAAQNVIEIIIATNNDANSDKNRGKDYAIKNFVILSKICDYNKIKIALPFKNDFGDCNSYDIFNWEKRVKNVNQSLIYKAVINYLEKISQQNKSTKADAKLLSTLKMEVENE